MEKKEKELRELRDAVFNRLDRTSVASLKECFKAIETRFINYSMANNPALDSDIKAYIETVEKMMEDIKKWVTIIKITAVYQGIDLSPNTSYIARYA